MGLPSKLLIGAIISSAGCVIVLSSIAANPQTIGTGPLASRQVAQVSPRLDQTNTALARMSLRIAALENEIRRLTGLNEELMHRLGQLEEQLKNSMSDTALRLKALEGAGKPPDAAGMAATTPTGEVNASGADAARAAGTSVAGADKGTKVLGALRDGPGGGAAKIARVVEPPSVAKEESPEQQYDRAHTLIVKHRKYGEAERVLRSFIDGNPEHALASNAHYWLGRTFFVRGDFENAAFAFAEGFQKFPKSKKAPANLLNLGMALSQLGKNREACTTYTRLLRTYKNAEASIKRRVARERQRAKCRRR